MPPTNPSQDHRKTTALLYMDWQWLVTEVADSARVPLPLGENRKGGTKRRPLAGNDQLDIDIYERQAHPFLRAIVERLHAQRLYPWTVKANALALVSRLCAYKLVRSDATNPPGPPADLRSRFQQAWSKPVKDAIVWVMENTLVGKTYHQEMVCQFYSQRVDRGFYMEDDSAGWLGMHSGTFHRMNRKWFELLLHPMRLDLPDNVEINVLKPGSFVHGEKIRVDDTRTEEARSTGIDIELATRLIGDREPLLFHPLGKAIFRGVKSSIADELDDPDLEDDVLRDMAADRLNTMYGFMNNGSKKQESDHSRKTTATTYFDKVVVKGMISGYEEYFGERTLTREEWIENLDNRVPETGKPATDFLKERRLGRLRVQYARNRDVLVEKSREWYARQIATYGTAAGRPLAVGLLENPFEGFVEPCLQLQQFPHYNVQVNENCVFDRYRDGTALPLPSASPYDAFQRHQGRIQVYFGISGQEDERRVGRYMLDKYFYENKTAMIADGWRCHVLWTLSDTDSIQRRYNAAWAEHHTQGWFMHGPLAAKFDCEWLLQEPRPLFGENRSNVPDNARIIGYVCVRFV